MINKKFKVNIVVIIVIAIIVIDQICKIFAINFADGGIGIISLATNMESKKVEDVVTSIFKDFVVFIIIIKFLREQARNMDYKVKLSLAFILGGGISNVIDKIWNKGNVISYIKIGSFSPINLAYIILAIGWIAFIFFMVNNTLRTNYEIKHINDQKRKIGRE